MARKASRAVPDARIARQRSSAPRRSPAVLKNFGAAKSERGRFGKNAAPGRSTPEATPELGRVLEFMRVIWGLDHALQRMSKRLEAHLGITSPQRLVLRIVGRTPGISAGDLARILHVHPSTLTGVLRRLETRQLLVRTDDPSDGRRALFRLSPAGERLDVSSPGTVEAAVRRVVGRNVQRSQITEKWLSELTDELENELSRRK